MGLSNSSSRIHTVTVVKQRVTVYVNELLIHPLHFYGHMGAGLKLYLEYI